VWVRLDNSYAAWSENGKKGLTRMLSPIAEGGKKKKKGREGEE